ncbi:MAG: CRTAC1 family protein, partial [Myxococcales bacterium]|nr:CRTAC1 family protein [Myxococcales bacterium]
GDGDQDLFVVNGLRSRGKQNYIPVLLEMIITPGVDFSDVNNYPDIGDMTWSGYQKQRFFHNLGDGTFAEMAAIAGVDNDLDGRGIAVADFDNDGLLDFYQTNANQPALLYRGTTEKPGNWVQLKLEGTQANRDAVGARVLLTAGGETYLREVNGGNGYSSQSAKRLHFGIGGATAV